MLIHRMLQSRMGALITKNGRTQHQNWAHSTSKQGDLSVNPLSESKDKTKITFIAIYYERH